MPFKPLAKRFPGPGRSAASGRGLLEGFTQSLEPKRYLWAREDGWASAPPCQSRIRWIAVTRAAGLGKRLGHAWPILARLTTSGPRT